MTRGGANGRSPDGRESMSGLPTKNLSLAAVLVVTLAACSPEVGSDAWCEKMQEKPKGDWTANEAGDYAKHCILR